LWLVQAAFVAALNDVSQSLLPSDTPTSKLRKLGILVYILELAGERRPIAVTSLVATSGLAPSAVGEIMDSLVKRGCLRETMEKNPFGIGKARQFDLAPAIVRLSDDLS
jgi:DNA-binding IclR family transcriptional regulator